MKDQEIEQRTSFDFSKESYVDNTIVSLYVTDLFIAINWYHDNFGLKLVSKGRDFATLSLGPGRIIYLCKDHGLKGGVQFSTKHIELLRQNLQNNGVKILGNDDPNSVWFDVIDPFGNKIGVWSGDRFGVNKLEFVHTPDMELGWCKLSSKGPLQVVGVKVDKNLSEIVAAFELMKNKLTEIKNHFDSKIFCVNPLEESFLYVCVEVEGVDDIPPHMVNLTVPAQEYAVFVYNQPSLNFRDSYRNKYVWLQGWTHLQKKPADVIVLEYFNKDGIECYLPYVDKV